MKNYLFFFTKIEITKDFVLQVLILHQNILGDMTISPIFNYPLLKICSCLIEKPIYAFRCQTVLWVISVYRLFIHKYISCFYVLQVYIYRKIHVYIYEFVYIDERKRVGW